MKKLIGISAPHNKLTLSAIEIISTMLNLEHINMRQPVVSMIAALMNEDATELHYEKPLTTNIEHLNTSVADMEITLAFNIRMLNPAYFIERTKAAIARSSNTIKGKLFDGHIIAGVTTELEADWVRNQGGIMIHIYDYTPQNLARMHALKEMDSDRVVFTSEVAPITSDKLLATIISIRDVYAAQEQAAA